MIALLILLGILIAVTVMIWVKALFGTPHDLYTETKFERGWLNLLDKWDELKSRVAR